MVDEGRESGPLGAGVYEEVEKELAEGSDHATINAWLTSTHAAAVGV